MNAVVLNKVIHEQARLKILVLLASLETLKLPFTEIKNRLDFTAGNLSIQLKTLEDAGYVAIKKYINGNKPQTDVSITETGRAALGEYINSLENLLGTMRHEN